MKILTKTSRKKTALVDPQATQMDDEWEGEDEEDADALKEEIKEKYATLNIKTYRIKELMGQKMKAGEAGSPCEMLDAMRSSIEEQSTALASSTRIRSTSARVEAKTLCFSDWWFSSAF